jgi:hypothetical protein
MVVPRTRWLAPTSLVWPDRHPRVAYRGQGESSTPSPNCRQYSALRYSIMAVQSLSGYAAPPHGPSLRSGFRCPDHQSLIDPIRLTRRQQVRSGSAPRSGRGGRRFKSCHSDQHLADSRLLTVTGCVTETPPERATPPKPSHSICMRRTRSDASIEGNARLISRAAAGWRTQGTGFGYSGPA